MRDTVADTMFNYILSVDDFRNNMPEEHRPSRIKITTITMVSKFAMLLDIPKLRFCFEKLGSLKIKMKGVASDTAGFEWKIKPSKFYNAIILAYQDQYSNKSIKIFPNGSIQVAGCSDLLNCRIIIKQLSFIFKEFLGKTIPHTNYRVVMINTNFSLNYHINLNATYEWFADSSIFDVSFDPDRYSAVKIKFKPAEDMKKVTVSIFRTGKIIITGAETLKEIAFAYNIINQHITSNASKIKVRKVDTPEAFDIVLGYKFDEWVKVLSEKKYRPWIFTRTNPPIKFS